MCQYSCCGMDMIMPLNSVVGMAVGGFIAAVDMSMAMDMRMLVGVNQIPMGVFVVVGMGMLMGMLQGDSVFHHQN